MGYLLLTASVLFSVAKGYCGKKTSGLLHGTADAVLISFVRMFFCVIIGLAFVLFQDGVGAFHIDGPTFWISALSGISTALFVASWLVVIRTGSYMMTDVFLTMGVIIPLALCNLLFSEFIRPVQWLGILLLFGAVYIMCSYNSALKGKMKPGAFGMLIFCGVCYGFSDFSQKLFIHCCPEGSVAVFNFYSYLFAALFLLTLFAGVSAKEKLGRGEIKTLLKQIYLYVMVMAICLFMSSYFKTMAAIHLPSAKLYPLFQGMCLTLATVMSSVCFKEKATPRCLMGVGLCFVALIFINVL